MTILHIDSNHPALIQQLEKAGFTNVEGYTMTREEILENQHLYDGIVIRSRIDMDRDFLSSFSKLLFVARVGAGVESIDIEAAKELGVELISAPEGNRNAVGEHTLGMLLSLFNKLNQADRQVRDGHWHREANRGIELEGKTVGIIGYGNMGRSFAKKLRGFDTRVLCYDIQPGVGDQFAQQVSLGELQQETDVLSLHTPWTPLTNRMVDHTFIEAFAKPFWLLNTARGKSVVTADLVKALQEKKILGAGLDVLEYEKSSFEALFNEPGGVPSALQQLLLMPNVLLSPHVAGWTLESHLKLATTISDKIIAGFGPKKGQGS